MTKYFFLIITLSCLIISCSTNNTKSDKEKEKIDKPVQMWIDAHANFTRFSSKANITHYLEKLKETGFNEIYVDIKPNIGYALYDSDILPKLTHWDRDVVERDWDYLTYWIEEAERLDISVIASISTLGYGYTRDKTGLVYEDPRWDGKTQMEMPNGDPDKIIDIRDQYGVDAAMLNPCLPEVQDFVISILGEIATKYPKLKGICIDYCRWYGGEYGFSDKTISAFEEYSGLKVKDKNELLAKGGGAGPLYKEWMEFRSMTITNLVSKIRKKVKSINPDIEFHLWAAADWNSRVGVGQNWASKRYKPTGFQYTDDYNKTGFADQLDVFSLGAYTEYLWNSEYPNSVWTIENFVTTYSDFTMGDCKVYGSITSYGYKNDPKRLSDAVYACLTNTEGLMVFELSHVIKDNQWDAFRDAINRAFQK